MIYVFIIIKYRYANDKNVDSNAIFTFIKGIKYNVVEDIYCRTRLCSMSIKNIKETSFFLRVCVITPSLNLEGFGRNTSW